MLTQHSQPGFNNLLLVNTMTSHNVLQCICHSSVLNVGESGDQIHKQSQFRLVQKKHHGLVKMGMLNILLNKTDLQYNTVDFCSFALAASEVEDNE